MTSHSRGKKGSRISSPFSLHGRVAVITGGAGLLGIQHARAIDWAGGVPVIADVDTRLVRRAVSAVGGRAVGIKMDVTSAESVASASSRLVRKFGRIDILINNAARNPKVGTGGLVSSGRIEDLSLSEWNSDLAVGLTGALLCARYFGEHMAMKGGGVILNIASDLALIGPDQRLYEKPNVSADKQPKKPVSYSVVKSGLLGLTRYLATYWADSNVRCNALCPGGVQTDQPHEFVQKLSRLIPLHRMARVNEYQGAVVFMCSDASSYMTGAVLCVDGGRTAW